MPALPADIGMAWQQFAARFERERLPLERRRGFRILLRILVPSVLISLAAFVATELLHLPAARDGWLWTPLVVVGAFTVAAQGPDMRAAAFLGLCGLPVWCALVHLAPLALVLQ
jgi:hypothetical protein